MIDYYSVRSINSAYFIMALYFLICQIFLYLNKTRIDSVSFINKEKQVNPQTRDEMYIDLS